jgi:hypothetical protein
VQVSFTLYFSPSSMDPVGQVSRQVPQAVHSSVIRTAMVLSSFWKRRLMKRKA